ncbi:MAG: glycosyltransferase [Nitrososphaerales archaeon]
MPPVFCPATVLLYCKATGSRLVTDAHTSARIWEVFAPLTKFVMRRSSISLVTNEEVKRRLTSSGIRSFVLEDAIPDLNSNSNVEVFQGSNIAVISTFAKDEPLEEVIRAAGMIPHVNFYVTGNLKFARNEHITNKPRNLFYTDFLDYEKYSSLLNSVDAIMVLTTNDNTMLSGACEAVAVGKPLITSNWSVLVKYFNKGTIHVNNTAEDIVEAVNKAISEKDRLTHEIKELRSLRRKEWNYKFKELLRLLEIR